MRIDLRRSLLYALAVMGLGASLIAFWPGYMEVDSFEQYGQAAGKLPLSDWHPVSMTLLWRTLLWLHDGPQPILVLQLLGYWGGFLYLACRLLRQTSQLPWPLAAIGAAGLPFLLNFSGVIWKDTHLALSLFWAASVLALGRASRVNASVSLAMICYGISVRHNGAAAGLPLMVLWSHRYAGWPALKGWRRALLGTLGIGALYLLSGALLRYGISYLHTSPWSAQMLNEMVFIKCRSSPAGVEALHDYFGNKLLSMDSQERSRYLCDKVSRLAARGDTNAIYGDQTLVLRDVGEPPLWRQWLRTGRTDFLGYLTYRLRVYETFLRPLSYPEDYYTALAGIDPNPFPFRLPAKTANLYGSSTALNDYIGLAASHLTLLFRPGFWLITLSVSVAALGACRRWVAFLVAGSGLLYLLGYLVALPAPDFRYAYYSIFAQVLALLLLALPDDSMAVWQATPRGAESAESAGPEGPRGGGP